MRIEDFYDVIRPMQVYVEVSEDILFAPERIESDPYRTLQDQDEVTRKAKWDDDVVPRLRESKVESEEESWISCLFFWVVRIHTNHTDSNPKDLEIYVHQDVVVVVVDAADNSPS